MNSNPFTIVDTKTEITPASLQIMSRNKRLDALIEKDFSASNHSHEKRIPPKNQSNLNLKFKVKENMKEFISNKKEIFMIQMSLDIKKAEISKLEESINSREKELEQAERLLEEDAVRFDAFLKENDKNAHEAMRQAEEETKKKNEKTQEVKKLTQKLHSIHTDIVRNQENLDECLKYKQFLDELIPTHHSRDEIYFTHPNQLMCIFTSLEEQNLFLIQNSQATELTLEDLNNLYDTTKDAIDNQALKALRHIDDVTKQIQREESIVEQYVKQKSSNGTETQVGPTNMAKDDLQKLNKKVLDVYEECGFNAASLPTSITMLAHLENKLESVLTDINRLPIEYVIKHEREKEKQRREKKREEQQLLMDQLQEERNRKAIERSLKIPATKRIGRPVMFRSKLIDNRNKKTDESKSNLNSDEMKHMN